MNKLSIKEIVSISKIIIFYITTIGGSAQYGIYHMIVNGGEAKYKETGDEPVSLYFAILHTMTFDISIIVLWGLGLSVVFSYHRFINKGV
ncbi:MAG: hypothetical protein IH588_05195 [Anaerolineales bacterium]|nr:hypothetical protein [Anaerolineales bacterium]